MNEGQKILFESLGVFLVLVFGFIGFSLFVYPNLNETDSSQEVLPAVDVLSAVDQSNAYAYECPETFTRVEVPNDYPTIQSAVDAVDSQTIISVAPGVYNESITLKPEVCLIAQEFGKSEIQGFGDVVVEMSSQSKLMNFKITGSGIGVFANNAQGVNLEVNTFENLEYGVFFQGGSEVSIMASSFRNVDTAIFAQDSEFFIEQNNIVTNSVALEIDSSRGDIVGLVVEDGEYGVRSENSDLFLDSNIFKRQTSVAIQLSNQGSYEIGNNFFDNVNEEILY